MAKYEKYDESEGVWRTVGGRRIFIRDGQSLSDAMKNSGKFKSAKKKVDYDKRPQSDVDKENERNNKAVEKIEKGKKDFDPNDFEKWRKEVDPDYEMDDDRARSRYESYKDANVRKEEHYAGEELYSDDPNRFGDKIRQHNERMAKEQEESAKRVQERYEKESSIKSQQSDIEKASGLKVKEAFSTDLYGNGKEDRFKLDDGRWISHTTESFGSKDDTWSVNKLENGSIKSQDFKSYDDMIKHLGGNNKVNNSDKYSQSSQSEAIKKYLQNDLSKKRLVENYFNGNNEKANEAIHKATRMSDKEYAKVYGEQDKDYMKRMYGETAAKEFDKKVTPYKKAFEEYKKKHPNSKLNFNQFVDMSEGK